VRGGARSGGTFGQPHAEVVPNDCLTAPYIGAHRLLGFRGMADGLARVVWLDDQNPIFRRGLAACIEAHDFEVAGESAMLNPEPNLDGIGMLVFDLDSPSGLQRAVQIAGARPVRLVGLVGDAREERLFDAVEAGLAGFLVRTTLTPDALVSCLEAVVSGHGSLPPALLSRLIDGLAKGGARGAAAGQLGRRELAVLRLLAEGGGTREIAQELSYSERTVKNIVHDVLVKMNCRTRAHAVATAARQGFI
jgi:DNA-binding NarL/FixJ family response regulator